VCKHVFRCKAQWAEKAGLFEATELDLSGYGTIVIFFQEFAFAGDVAGKSGATPPSKANICFERAVESNGLAERGAPLHAI
jgi:hypothetical protein